MRKTLSIEIAENVKEILSYSVKKAKCLLHLQGTCIIPV